MHNMWGYILVILIMICHTANFLTAQQQRGYPTRVNFPAVETPQKISGTADFDTLLTIKEDFMVNDLAGEGGAGQYNSSVAMDSQGNFAIIWVDERNGREDLYIQFYDPQKNKKGSNILVDESIDPNDPVPAVSCNKNGQFVVAWSKTGAELFAKVFNSEGSEQTDIFAIDSSENQTIRNLSLAVSESGKFIINWLSRDHYNVIKYIYARVFSDDGIPLAGKVLIKQSNINISYPCHWSVATDGNGNYLAAWGEVDGSDKKVFIQKIDNNGLLIGENTIVHTFLADYHSIITSVCGNENGNYLITWSCEGVTGKTFNWENGFIGEFFHIYPNPDFYFQSSVNIIDDYRFLTLFSDGHRLKYRTVTEYGHMGDMISLDDGSSDLFYGQSIRTTNFSNDLFYFTWYEYYGIDRNIYLREVNLNNNTLKELENPADDIFGSKQERPRLHINNQGKVLVVWVDERNKMQELYAQLYDGNNKSIGNNIRISDSEETSYNDISDFVTGSFSDGSFLLAYIDRSDNCCFQKLSQNGAPEGDLKIVATDKPDNMLEMKINDKDEILLSILSSFHHMEKVEIHHYDKSLDLVSPVSQCIEENNDVTRRPSAISINEHFDIFVTWGNRTDKIYGDLINLYGLIFNSKGEVISDTLLFGEMEDSFYSSFIDNKIDINGNVSVAWSYDMGYAEEYTIKNLYFESDKTIVKEHKFSPGENLNFQPEIIEFQNNKALVSWSSGNYIFLYSINENINQNTTYLVYEEDSEPINWWEKMVTSSYMFNNSYYYSYSSFGYQETGEDLFLGIKELDFDTFGPEYLVSINEGDYLYNNFPNPFNSATRITFRLLAYHHVKLAIYDILGREVEVIVNEDKEPGLYEVDFDASTLPSGVYFCRLKAFDTKVIKMLHLK